MKKIFYVAMIIGLISCDQNENGTHSAALGANATAGLDESVTISDVSAAITPFNITIVEIMDSRCPVDPHIRCVSAGFASAGFEVGGFTFSLKIDESKEFTTGGSAFKLTLIDVLPYPTSANMEDEKKIVFVVHSL